MSVLVIKNLSYSYKQKYILKDLNLIIRKGEIYGILGKPKSGKTTIVNIILGITSISQGHVFIFDRDYSTCRGDILSVTGNVLNIPYFLKFLTVWENFKYLDSKYHYGEERILCILKQIGLLSVKRKKVRALKLEQQKKLSIGLALFHDPDLLIFDDLFRDLDEDSIKKICKLLEKIKATGKSILITSRYLSEMTSICTRIGLLSDGYIAIEGTAIEVEHIILTERKDRRVYSIETDAYSIRYFERVRC